MNDHTVSGRSQRLATRRATKKVGQSNNQENTNCKTNKSKLVQKTKGDKKRSISEMSPNKSQMTTRKRAAFGDITNAIQQHSERMALGRKKPIATKVMTRRSTETALKKKTKVTVTKPNTRRSAVTKPPEVVNLPDSICSELITSNDETKCSQSVLSETSNCDWLFEDSSCSNASKKSSRPLPDLSFIHAEEKLSCQDDDMVPDNVRAFDTDDDPNVVSEYAQSIFRNMKKRELKFAVENYLIQDNTETTGPMRAILIDWLVEVQENFELYHETLYLAIKITDVFLQNNPVPKENLQLVGATSLLMACKIEERHPPPLDDFQFICDDAYTHRQFTDMEMRIFNALDFDINIPIPYRFLRRYARASGMSMQILTLSRYILELSIHEADFVDIRPSQIAAACLCLAVKMKEECTWDEALTYHAGYTENELKSLVTALNKMVALAPNSKLQTVRTKYSHPIFYQVANIPPLTSL